MKYKIDSSRKHTGNTKKKLTTEQLSADLDDLNVCIELNKKVLQDIIPQKIRERPSIDSGKYKSTFTKILERLFKENLQLDIKLAQTNTEASKEASKALINEQIVTELIMKQEQKRQEYRDTLWELEYVIERKNRVIENIKSAGTRLRTELNILLKTRNLIPVSPTPLILLEHGEFERMRENMQNQARAEYSLMKYKQTLQEQCKSLNMECDKLAALLKNPITRKHERLPQSRYSDLRTHPKNKFSPVLLPEIREDGPFKEEIDIFKTKQKPTTKRDLQMQRDKQRLKKQTLELKEEMNGELQELLEYHRRNDLLRGENEKLAKHYEDRASIHVNQSSVNSVLFYLPISEEEELVINPHSFYNTTPK